MDGFTYERAAITECVQSSEFRVYSSLTRQTDQDSPISRSLECGSEMGTPRRSRARATLESKRVTPNLTIVEQ